MKILVTGGNGQLGREFSHRFQEKYELLISTRANLDVTDSLQVASCFESFRPDVVIHCAAYTNVDAAENDFDGAFRGNVIAAQNVAVQSLKYDTKMVFVSTDYVFDGYETTHYREFDAVNPLNVYGKTKLYGENIVKEVLGKHFIVRTSWLYGDGNNFVKTMLRLATEREILQVVNDQIGSPTYTKDLTLAIEKLILSDSYGTYHATCGGECSWYDFACEIFKSVGNNTVRVEPVTTDVFPRAATRPSYSVLENYMLSMTVGDPMREWQDALKEYIDYSDF